MEDYKKKYEDALELMKDWHNDSTTSQKEKVLIEAAFPELAESEDERMLCEIKQYIKDQGDKPTGLPNGSVAVADMVAWLEKQGNLMGALQEANKKIGELVEENYYLKEQGEQKESYDTCVSTPLNDKKTPYGEKRDFGYFKKQNDQKPVCEQTVKNLQNNSFRRMFERKPTDKVEPKFKIGDWVVFKNRHQSIYQVEKIEDGCYILRHTHGGTFRVCILHDESLRLWTIQDAKDGDVLYLDLMCGKTFIYNGINPNMAILYSFIISNDGEDVLPYHIGKPNTGIGYIEESKNIIHPATKEQRDLLFQKLKEAGYEWDEVKRELKKIEQKSVKWSEEDDANIIRALAFIENTNIKDVDEIKESVINWLKSLRPQNRWKPSEEQLEALKNQCVCKKSTETGAHLCELYNDLKKLTE